MEPVRWPPRVRGVGGSRQMRVSCNPLWKNNLYGPVAQFGRAPDLHSGGRGFDACSVHHLAFLDLLFYQVFKELNKKND